MFACDTWNSCLCHGNVGTFFSQSQLSLSGLRRKLTNGLRVTWWGLCDGGRVLLSSTIKDWSRGDHETAPEARREEGHQSALQSLSQTLDRKEHRWEFMHLSYILSLKSVFVFFLFYSEALWWSRLTVSLLPCLSEAETMKSAHSLAGLLLLIIIQSSWQVPDQDTDRNSV